MSNDCLADESRERQLWTECGAMIDTPNHDVLAVTAVEAVRPPLLAFSRRERRQARVSILS
jgi:hypothetical protein